jgi:hypothetical protein
VSFLSSYSCSSPATFPKPRNIDIENLWLSLSITLSSVLIFKYYFGSIQALSLAASSGQSLICGFLSNALLLLSLY